MTLTGNRHVGGPLTVDLPSGALKTASYVWNPVSLAWEAITGSSDPSSTNVAVTNFPTTQPVSGTFYPSESASAATLSNVSGSASSVTLLSANANRRGAVIVNDSTAVLYVKFGATASATSYSYRLAAYATLEFPKPVYAGVVDGIWASAAGAARMTEMT